MREGGSKGVEGVKGAQGPITGNKGKVDSLWRLDVGTGDVFLLIGKQTNKQIEATNVEREGLSR